MLTHIRVFYAPVSKYHKQKIGHNCNWLVLWMRLLLYQKLIDIISIVPVSKRKPKPVSRKPNRIQKNQTNIRKTKNRPNKELSRSWKTKTTKSNISQLLIFKFFIIRSISVESPFEVRNPIWKLSNPNERLKASVLRWNRNQVNFNALNNYPLICSGDFLLPGRESILNVELPLPFTNSTPCPSDTSHCRQTWSSCFRLVPVQVST